MSKQGIEIEFFPVGEGKHSGDAITVRYGTPGNYKIMVYDGGTKKSGVAIVEHIQRHYATDRVDYVVNSHPDGDHASGLSVVMEELEVGELWMHQPWDRSEIIRDQFSDRRMTDSSLAERLKRKMGAAHDLERIALHKGVPIFEPFQGDQIGIFKVLSPGEYWYTNELVREFIKSPEPKKVVAATEALEELTEALIDMVEEEWDTESLRENVRTSAENESSVVLFGEYANRGILLTGDSGVRALTEAAAYAELEAIDLRSRVTFCQVPHHGSRNNVSTSTLDLIFGPALTKGQGKSKRTAYISASRLSDQHPDLAVINAFIRRGFNVFQTKGKHKHHQSGMQSRKGWSKADSLEFSDFVRPW